MSAPDLAALVDAYAQADADVKAAEDRRKDLRDQLLLAWAEGQGDHPGEITTSMHGARATVSVGRVESWRVNTAALKAEHPEVYAAYARKSTSTRLTVVPR